MFVLDGFLAEPGVDPTRLCRTVYGMEAGVAAVTWINERVLFDNPLNTLRSTVATAPG